MIEDKATITVDVGNEISSLAVALAVSVALGKTCASMAINTVEDRALTTNSGEWQRKKAQGSEAASAGRWTEARSVLTSSNDVV